MIVSDVKTFLVGTHFLSAIFNGDYSGLNSAESLLLDNWLANNVHGYTESIENEESQLTFCAITKLMSDCTEVNFILFK